MSKRMLVVCALAAPAALMAAPAAAFDTKQDDLRWVGIGSEPSINFNGRYIVFSVSGKDVTKIGWRDMNRSGTTKGVFPGRLPSIGYSWTRSVWQAESQTVGSFCDFEIDRPLLQIYLAAAQSTAQLLVPSIVSRSSTDDGQGNAKSELAVLSGDGNHVAFESRAGNLSSLVPGCSRIQVFVRNLRTQATRLVSIGMDGAEGDQSSTHAAVGETGRYVAFTSGASNLVPGDDFSSNDVFVRDMDTDTTSIVSHADRASKPTGGIQPAISGDGRFVAYTAKPPTGVFVAGTTVVYVRDMQSDTAVIVSRANGPNGAPVAADRPSISADGRYVSFVTSDASAVPDPVTLTVPNGIVRDLQTGENRLDTRAQGPTGAPLDTIDGNDTYPRLSGSGRYLVFWTLSDDISRFGRKNAPDIYLRDVWGPPPDVDTVAPVLTNVRLTPKSFTRPATCDDILARSRLLFTSSEAGAVQVQFRQKLGKVWTVVATLERTIDAGENTIPLNGCVGIELLPKGSLKVGVTVTDAAYNASATKSLSLKIK